MEDFCRRTRGFLSLWRYQLAKEKQRIDIQMPEKMALGDYHEKISKSG